MKNSIITLVLLFITSLGYSQKLNYPQKIDDNNQIIVHTAYTLSYNETYEQSNWVKYLFLMKNEKSDLDILEFMTPLSTIESLFGLMFKLN
jgi:hypothetical protein